MVMTGKKYQLTQWQEATRIEMCFSNIIYECYKQTMIYVIANAILFSVEKGSR